MKEWKDMTKEEQDGLVKVVEAFMVMVEAVANNLVPVVSTFEDVLDAIAKNEAKNE